MPGGRGTILDIASALNSKKSSAIAEGIKVWINTGYRVDASVSILGAAFDKCDHEKVLLDVWCHASNQGAVDSVEY